MPSFAFDVSTHGIAEPAHCTASADAGFSGATYLALIYEGLGKCDNADVTWTFYQPSAVETAPPKDATLNVTINGVRGTYIIPGSDITASLNDKENPFDNDVAYTGPKAFSITKFVRVEEEA